jgi:hypothetical protein
MKKSSFAWLPVVFLFVGSVFGQISQGSLLPHKELVFPQIAVGGQYQTWVTVTNRGTQPWLGTFNFYKGQGIAWNPYVNGTQISGGYLAVQIASKTTVTYKITMPGDIQPGYLVASTNNTSLDNFIEGNLTYYISSNGAILDSIGIRPSNPIIASSIPFEDFSTLAFAFANTDTQARTAIVTMRLFSDTNASVGNPAVITLTSKAHIAQYLNQAFPAVSATSWRGRLEIESTVPVSAVALTQVSSGQFSSLPIESTTRTYSISSSSSHVPFAQMTLWAEGLLINGYGLATGYSDLFGLFGQIASDGSLHVHFDGKSAVTSNMELFGYMKTEGAYSAGASSFSGTYYTNTLSSPYFETGTFTATLVP